MGQQNHQEETTNSKNPLWDGDPPWGEWISAENLTAIGKSFDLKNQKMTQKLGKIFWSIQRTSFIVIILNREFNLRAETRNHPLFHKIYIIERNSEKKYTIQGSDWRKAKTSEAKSNSIVLTLQGKDGILYAITTSSANFVPMKRSQESSSLNSLWRCGTAYLWDKIPSSNPKSPGTARYSQVWTWEERSTNSECCSDQRTSGIESYVWFRRHWRSVSGSREV